MVACVVLGAAADASAQWCADTPIRPGRPGAQAATGFTESATSLTLSYRAAVKNLWMNAGYWSAFPDVGDTSHGVHLGVTYDVPLAEGRICPRAGFAISNDFAAADVSDGISTGVSFGVSAATVAYEGETVRLTPFVFPSYSYATTLSEIDEEWRGRWDVGTGVLVQWNDRAFAIGSLRFDRDGYDGLTLSFGWLLR